jgi:DMSO/TMAO reductase YedYZ molybdopterin-dependent catalytic subunit
MAVTRTALPPGQRAVDGFPRFGTHLDRRPPEVPQGYAITIDAPGFSTSLSLADLRALPRRDLVADFHCVSGWSALDVAWSGVPFASLFEQVVAAHLPPGPLPTHVLFTGLDGHESLLLLEDALDDGVLVADRLADEELSADHGAPVRIVSPAQYGYQSCKHLRRIEFLRDGLNREVGTAHPLSRVALRGPFVVRHPRARVAEEERHTFLPAWLLRPFYRRIYERAFRTGLGADSA